MGDRVRFESVARGVVTKFNYYRTTPGRLFGTHPALWWDRQCTIGASAILAAFALSAIMWIIQVRRVALLDGQLTVLQVRAAAEEPAADRATRLSANIARLRRQRDELVAARRETVEQTNKIALIGNRLPRQTWLSALRAGTARWSLTGRSARLTELGMLLRTLHEIDPKSDAHLVSATADTRHERMVEFVISWDRSL